MLSHDDIKLLAKKGAYWLDEVYPEWYEAIDLQYLDLQNSHQCVLGQISNLAGFTPDQKRETSNYNGFQAVMHFLAGGQPHTTGSMDGYNKANRFLEEHGFNIPEGEEDDPEFWDSLNEAWKQEIYWR